MPVLVCALSAIKCCFLFRICSRVYEDGFALRFIAKSLAEIFKFVALFILSPLFDHSLINQKTFLGVFSCSAIELLSLAQFATVFCIGFWSIMC